MEIKMLEIWDFRINILAECNIFLEKWGDLSKKIGKKHRIILIMRYTLLKYGLLPEMV